VDEPELQVGIVQYITPTLQLALGTFVYHETFTYTHLGGFVLIRSALVIIALKNLIYGCVQVMTAKA
jgi:chloramphenicol-sensitive protein RarD